MNTNNIKAFLQGKKTYIIAAFALLYALGAHFKLWPLDPAVLSAIGAGGVATFAAKIERLLGDTPPEDKNASNGSPVAKTSLLLGIIGLTSAIGLACLMVSLITGCGSTPKKKLEVGGAYAPGTSLLTTNAQGFVTNAMVSTSLPDPAFYVADSSFDIAESLVDAAFKVERDNRAFFWKIDPTIKHKLDQLRPQVWKLIGDYTVAREIYKANPTPVVLSELQSFLAQLQTLSETATEMTQNVINKN